MKFGLFFLLVIICAFIYTAYADLQSEIKQECIKPDLTVQTKTAITLLGKRLEMPIGRTHIRAQVLPFETIRKEVCDKYPKNGCPIKLKAWKETMENLNDDLHTIDTKWFRRSARNAVPQYARANTGNKKLVTASLKAVIESQGPCEKSLAEKIGTLLKYMNSATANIRPGYATVSRRIGDRIDPLLMIEVTTGSVIESKLTPHSKHLKETWHNDFMRNSGSILTSDNERLR